MANPTKVTVTGAAGQIGYALLFRIASGQMLGEDEASERMEKGIAEVIRKGDKVTYDLKPSRDDPSAVGTSEFADAVIKEMN